MKILCNRFRSLMVTFPSDCRAVRFIYLYFCCTFINVSTLWKLTQICLSISEVSDLRGFFRGGEGVRR